MSQRKKLFRYFLLFLEGRDHPVSCVIERSTDVILSALWLIRPPLHRKLVESVPTSVYYKLVSGYRGCDTVELLTLVRAGIQMFFPYFTRVKGQVFSHSDVRPCKNTALAPNVAPLCSAGETDNNRSWMFVVLFPKPMNLAQWHFVYTLFWD